MTRQYLSQKFVRLILDLSVEKRGFSFCPLSPKSISSLPCRGDSMFPAGPRSDCRGKSGGGRKFSSSVQQTFLPSSASVRQKAIIVCLNFYPKNLVRSLVEVEMTVFGILDEGVRNIIISTSTSVLTFTHCSSTS